MVKVSDILNIFHASVEYIQANASVKGSFKGSGPNLCAVLLLLKSNTPDILDHLNNLCSLVNFSQRHCKPSGAGLVDSDLRDDSTIFRLAYHI